MTAKYDKLDNQLQGVQFQYQLLITQTSTNGGKLVHAECDGWYG